MRGPTDFKALRQACLRCPHGTRARYIAGCKCMHCRAANSMYEVERAVRRKNGDWNGIVDASEARRHMLYLSRKLGIGRHAVSAATGIGNRILFGILRGERRGCRARTARLILAVDADARADGSLVSARRAWRLIRSLLARGYTKKQVARWLGSKAKVPSLQLNPRRITARNALRVERMVRLIDAGKLERDA